MTYHQLKSQEEYDEWDTFVQKSTKGHFAQLSTYLKSFTAYGANFMIIMAKEKEIQGGVGLLVFGKGPFKLVSLPMGPVIKEGSEKILYDLINEALQYAKSIKAFLFQMQIPYSQQTNHPSIYSSIKLPETSLLNEGFPFKVGSIVNQFFVISLDIEPTHETWEESILMTFDAKTRRNIRTAEKNNLSLREAITQEEIKEAYALMIENGITQGYATRSWEEFGATILEQVKKKQAIFTTVFKDEKLLGAHYGITSGNNYTYIMGATRRIEKDYKIGHFLHWSIIKKAKALGLKRYDFSSTGSPGVYKFKLGFKPTQYIFNTPYYYVLSKGKFKVFQHLFPILKQHKKNLAKLIGLFMKR